MSLAKELKMTMKQISNEMDAAELTEWMAFYMLQNDEQKEKLELKLKEESSQAERNKELRYWLSKIKGR